MLDIAIISNNEIICKIFSLVSKKISLSFDVYASDDIKDDYKFIIIDDEISIDLKKIDNHAQSLILLSERDTHSTFYNHIIKKPFLPSTLLQELENIIAVSQDKKIAFDEPKKQNFSNENEDKDSTLKYESDTLESLVNNVMNDLEEDLESPEDLMIDKASLSHGGILDMDELNKLSTLLDDSLLNDTLQNTSEDWIDLSNIIDKAIDDLEAIEFNKIKPINLLINKSNLIELKPLLKKLNQEIIDSLVEGEEITLKLKLEK